MRAALAVALLSTTAACAVLAAEETRPAAAHADKPESKDKEKDLAEALPFPSDASVRQTARVAGRSLTYTATVGSLPLRDDKGKKTAEVVFTAYVLDGEHGPDRPVTFAFNGGPGASSVYLNLGAIGPRRLQFGAQGDSPSDPVRLVDNPGSWLDFTDLVFIDPVGTGFSRALVPADDAKKRFFSVDADIEYLSRIVYDWLLKNGRLASPKYLVGESYGGYRGPRIAHFLQARMGVGVKGVTLVSPALDATFHTGEDVSPLPWVVDLPSMAAAFYERQGKPLTPQTMGEVEAYARSEFASDLMRGADPAALERLVRKVVAFTGLDPAVVRHMGGRVDSRTFLRALYRDQGKLGSWYDSNVTAWDPFPWTAESRARDPILEAIVAPTTSAMVDFITRTVGWKVEAAYQALSHDVNESWESGWWRSLDAVSDLRQAVAVDPRLRVLIVHGYDDLSCPYFASRLVLDQMPPMGAAGRVKLSVYPGGHMFYSRPDSQAALRRDVLALYGR